MADVKVNKSGFTAIKVLNGDKNRVLELPIPFLSYSDRDPKQSEVRFKDGIGMVPDRYVKALLDIAPENFVLAEPIPVDVSI